MKTPTPATPDRRLDHLLDVAADLFLQKGFAATSMGEIAAHAKASKSTFYSRFPTKAKLFTEVFRRTADHAFPEFSAILKEAVDPKSVLCSIARRLVFCISSSNCVDLTRLVYMEARQIPELGRIYYEMGPKRGYDQMSEYFQELVVKGFFRKEMDTRLGAEQFHDLITGELVRRRALAMEPGFSAEEQQHRTDATVDMFLRAYQA